VREVAEASVGWVLDGGVGARRISWSAGIGIREYQSSKLYSNPKDHETHRC